MESRKGRNPEPREVPGEEETLLRRAERFDLIPYKQTERTSATTSWDSAPTIFLIAVWERKNTEGRVY